MIQTSDFHFPYIPERLQRLSDLAVNLWFSWHTKALGLFQYADAVLWEDVYHNPVNFLHQIGAQRLEELAKDQKYLDKYDTVIQAFDHYMNSSDTWFMAHHADKAQKLIGYFSMEFGIHECLPTYSGGLGLPFLLVALAIEPFIRVIKRFRPYFGAIERVIGVLLVATGIAFLTGSIQDMSAWLLQSFPGLANLG